MLDVDALEPLTWELMVVYEQIEQGYSHAHAAQVTEAALYLKGFLKSFAEKK